MDLTTATNYANQIVTWLRPFCDRLAIAGSVRRQRPICNDIDLVVIPKFSAPPTDLFGNTAGARGVPLHAMLVNYVRDYSYQGSTGDPPVPVGDPPAVPRWQTGEHNPEGTNFILQLPKCQLDIYIATPENWGSKLVQRTGSKEHNTWLASRARDLGHKWELDRGILDQRNFLVAAETEEAIYSALSLQFIPPIAREGGLVRVSKPITDH